MRKCIALSIVAAHCAAASLAFGAAFDGMPTEVPAAFGRPLEYGEIVGPRLAEAQWVIVGEVTSVAPFGIPGPISEHAPDWQIAVVRVDELLKGPPGLRQAAVVFAGSRDIAWFRAPKLRVSQKGVFILGKQKPGSSFFELTNPEDLRPLSELPRLRPMLPKPAKRP